MKPAVIRRASPGDLAAIHHLEKACFGRHSFSREHIRRVLSDARTTTFLYVEGDRVLGSVMVSIDGSASRIISIGTHPTHQRRGIGRRLMQLAEEQAVRSGAQEIRLEVGVGNIGAIRFYKLLGYSVQGTLPRYYSWGEDAYAMTKPLPRHPGNV
jgi:ribosomal protein S18 acetylase RimI-like enzyme